MKVEFHRSAGPEGQILHGAQDLVVGQEYLVLELVISKKNMLLRLLIGPDSFGESHSALYPSWAFATTSEIMPKNWRIRIDTESLMLVGPEAWMTDGFWERYYDGESEARRIFEVELKIVLEGS